MKQLIRLMGVLLVCGAFTAAFAGPESYSGKESKAVAPAPPPECNWTGFYIGVNVGGQWGHSEDKDFDDYNFLDKPWGYSESGVVAGGQLGYNFQWNWLVLGIESDLGYMDLEGSGVEPGSPGNDTKGVSNSDFFTTIRGRLGFAWRHWLFYGTGGGIGVNYETSVNDDCTVSPCGSGEIHAQERDFDWGWTAGGGIEYMFGCHWTAKVEYLRFELDKQDFSNFNAAGAGPFRFNGNTAGNILRAGLNYKF